jgi:hydroxymethylpyrimidine/phosphomethylpyrimidine kinase
VRPQSRQSTRSPEIAIAQWRSWQDSIVTMRVALTIAGSDSAAAAGIQADLKTFAAHGVYGATAVTAITAQNSRRIEMWAPIAADMVTAQIDAVAADFHVDAVKIGMLGTRAVAQAVADALRRHRFPHVVLDPVIVATTGAVLLEPDAVEIVKRQLLPLASVVTPNAREAAMLTGVSVHTPADARDAARRLAMLGAPAVIVKGGHLDDEPVDVVLHRGVFTELAGPRLDTAHVHGTGCAFAAALAARLAVGDALIDAAAAAKAYVARAIASAPGLGRGRGPLGHL